MVPIVLVFLAAQGLPHWSEPGKRETLGYRPLRRVERFYQGRARLFGGAFDTDAALLRALDGLARSQNIDGSWDSSVGTTAVALLAFLDAGFTTWAQADCRISTCRSGASTSPMTVPDSKFHLVIRRAVDYLRRAQGPDGFVGERGFPTSFRDHAIAARALCEAWGGSHLLILADPAQRAIGALTVEPGLDDAAVAWTATAFRSAITCWLPHSRATGKRLALGPPPQAPNPLRSVLEVFLGPRNRTLPSMEETADPHLMYWGTEALYRYDTGSRIWTRWAQSVGAAIRTPPESGSPMDGALRALTLTVVYPPAIFEADR